MEYNKFKQKSFLQNFTWVWIMLLAMGIPFLAVAVIMQLIPINPEDLHTYVNGVLQPPTESSVFSFRLIFLLVFGVIGLGCSIAGFIVAGFALKRRRLAARRKDEGVCVTAAAAGYEQSFVRVNFQYLMRLRCAYAGSDGITYIFKSGLLRTDPVPYLNQGQVNVYYDRDNISRYFVDVDGSAGLNEKVVEL